MTITFNPSKVQSISNYNIPQKQKFMKSIAEGGLARFIALEACVELGRTYQAYKRGGFDEGRERITEEATGAVFWLGGIKFFNSIIDKIGKKVLKLNDVDFDLGKDKARNPLENYVNNKTLGQSKEVAEKFAKKINTFKGVKVITSVLLANTMIGFVVPKINQAITRYYHRNDKNNNIQSNNNNQQINPFSAPKIPTINNYMGKDKKDVSFGQMGLIDVARNLETNNTWQLLSSDAGTASGRIISARNNDERVEIGIRDIGSIFFYMFSMPLINQMLNKFEQDGNPNRIDSANAEYTKNTINEQIKFLKESGAIDKEELTVEQFRDLIFGNDNENIIKINNDINIRKNDFMQVKNGVISLEEFNKSLETIIKEKGLNSADVEKFKQKAQMMSELQPKNNGIAILTEEQVNRIFKGGMINDPQYLKNLYELQFGTDEQSKLGKFFSKLFGKEQKTVTPNYKNPYRFIDHSDTEKVIKDVENFANKIIQEAKKAKDGNSTIDSKMLERITKKNFRMNCINWGSGFLVSALFLSTLIPKFQYWVTQKRTGSNEFPGTEEFRKSGRE